MKWLIHSKMKAVLIFVTFADFTHFYWRPTPFKSVTMTTKNALFPTFEFQSFTNAYLGKVAKMFDFWSVTSFTLIALAI